MCKVLKVGKSAYYEWCLKPSVPDNQVLREAIKATHKESRGTYGHRRIRPAVNAMGLSCGKNLVIRIMQEESIRGKMKRLRPYGKAKKQDYKKDTNILSRNFEVKAIDEVWLSDITYIWTLAGWVYLAVILDLCSRKVVGWAVSVSPDTDLILRAFWNAVILRRPRKGCMMHHDQGCQYTSGAWKDSLDKFGFVQSMSGRGQCWDNAPMESWNGILKRESDIVTVIRMDIHEVKSALFMWIETWYNTRRLHSKLGYQSPDQFEQKMAA
jgi:transposase InsO family protein